MIHFHAEEKNLICLYDPGSRIGLIHELGEMMKALTPEEDDLAALSKTVVEKLERITDEAYDALVKELPSVYPLEDDSFTDEDAAYGWPDPPVEAGFDPDAAIE